MIRNIAVCISLFFVFYFCFVLFFSFFLGFLIEKGIGRRRTRRRRIQSICVFCPSEGKRLKKGLFWNWDFFLLQIHCVDLILEISFFGECFRLCMYMGGCVTCYKNPTEVGTVDVPSNGLNNQSKASKIPSISEDFWTTGTLENVDTSVYHSQGSMSSTGATNQALVPHSGSSKTSNPEEFVNHGLILWNQTRQSWVENKRPANRTPQLREPKLSWNASYESLLGSNRPFKQPVPLAEMVDFLVDIWEQEGLYD